MISINDNYFELSTENTTYAFCVGENGLLYHLHYGARLLNSDKYFEDTLRALSMKAGHSKGTTITYENDSFMVLEDTMTEVSALGKGDFKEPFVVIEYADGSRTSDFIFESYRIPEKCEPLTSMPSPTYDEKSSQLEIVLKERFYPVKLVLTYTVFEDCDVITRRAKLINEGEEAVDVERLMSSQIDIDDVGFKMITFKGNWAREMHKCETLLSHGLYINRSLCGASSNRNNPFVMLTKEDTGEDHGEGYGFNLIYSGNHMEGVETASFGNTRFISGIDTTEFGWHLEKGEELEAPEAVMTFSDTGYRGISKAMHAFVRNHIVRGKFKDALRPILINSWEAMYFNISESKLCALAKEAKNLGIELFVMDDGWFKGRNDDTSSLGDWICEKDKLPGGIKRIADKIHEIGLSFGLWVEPEMINENSDLYREHPEYALTIPGRNHSTGRNQMVLDLTNPEVVDYIKKSMYDVFSSGDIDYVKWDMNRMFSDAFGKTLPKERKKETAHRYMLGLYDIMKYLTESFPDILFEGCASGGNRFDLGILSFMPQIWASDDTDAIERTIIQTGYSYGYPMSVVTSHVSTCPNHQTLRNTPLRTRFNVAAFGLLGYELNLCELPSDQKKQIKEQVETYKKWREVLQTGDFYRVNDKEWITVSKDRKKAVVMKWNILVKPNMFNERLRTVGLDDEMNYHIYNVLEKHNIKEFGDLVNQVSPIHVKKDSLLHNTIARFVKINGEVENYLVSGSLLNNAGIVLSQAFGGTGIDDEGTRVFQDFASRMYFIEADE